MHLHSSDRPTIHQPHRSAAQPAFLRRERLRDELLATVDSLDRHRVDLLADGFVADYVALRWLEWDGDRLRLTEAGARVCDLLRARQHQ